MMQAPQGWSCGDRGVTALVAATFCLAGLLAGCGGERPGTPASPNGAPAVIVIAVDGLRPDVLGCYGGSEARTPNLDSLAAESIRFDLALAQAPGATPSAATLVTGLYPTTHGVISGERPLSPEVTTLAEVLAAGGFTTAAFVEPATGMDAEGLAQGFGTFEVTESPGVAATAWLENHLDEKLLVMVGGWAPEVYTFTHLMEAAGTPPDGFVDRLALALDPAAGDAPSPLTDADRAFSRASYLLRVELIDRALGTFLETFRALGLDRRATLVVLGTTGRDLGEHRDPRNQSVHATTIRVPLLIRLPGAARAQSVNRVVELADVMPTLLELVDVPAPAGIQGASLMPIVDGASTPPYIAFSETSHRGRQRSVVLAGLQLVKSLDGDSPARLFDLEQDPLGTVDVSTSMADQARVLESHLEAWGKMVAAASYDPDLRVEELDDATLEQLKSLGYIQ